jgi:hypothetical protein
MGLFRKILSDAVELARALEKKRPEDGGSPTMREAVKAAMTQDGYKVLFMSRVRESARKWHVPGVNHALRLVTTVLYSIEIGNDIELGDGVNFTHTLGTVIGGREPRTRAEITKQVWDYIRSKGLQDAANRRSINADAALRPVFGKDQVTMFELPRLINDHVEKV